MYLHLRIGFRAKSVEDRVSQIASILLPIAAVCLTVCFGVAASQASDGKELEFARQIPQRSHGWKASPSN